jgi:hypothetical protein
MPPGIVYEGGRPGPGAGGKSVVPPRRWAAASRTLGSCDEEDAEGEDEGTVASATGAGEDEDVFAGQDEGASVASSIEAAMAEKNDTAASPMHVNSDGSSLPVRLTNLNSTGATVTASTGDDATSSASLPKKPSIASSLFDRVMESLEEPSSSTRQGPDSVLSGGVRSGREPTSRGEAAAGMNKSAAPETTPSASSYALAPTVAPEDSWLDMILMPKRGQDSELRDNFFRDDDRIEDEDSPEFDLMPSSAAPSGYGAVSFSSSAGVGGSGAGALSGTGRYAPLSSADPPSNTGAPARWSVGRGTQPRR